ncbi:hypothetical protein CVT25_014617 [Psilocybe cyanescens]|uniref:Uncharacterized protein n=1 Tax=Psilocybe cyanescens TaxID=93625 RepID=A0A409VVK3_PSICY|nr:hypothetical protein CVT25_014617 [Psilocybe cyanescens]
MRSVIYVIVPALSLLNMGVEAATIAKALTTKHSGDSLQARKIVHGRQFHNADFGLDSGHVARNRIDDVMSDDVKSTITNNDGTMFDTKGNPEFTKTVFGETGNSGTSGINTSGPGIVSSTSDSGVVSDVSNASVGSGKISSEDSNTSDSGAVSDSSKANLDPSKIFGLSSLLTGLGTGEAGSTGDDLATKGSDSINGVAGILTSAAQSLKDIPSFAKSKLYGSSGSSGIIPGQLVGGTAQVSERRQVSETTDGDSTEDITTMELQSMSSSLDKVSSIESGMAVPQSFERRMIKVPRENGVVNLSLQGLPTVNQSLPAVADPSSKRSMVLERDDDASELSSNVDID